MLPDLPSLKSELQQVLLRYFRSEVDKRMGVFRQASRHTAHEGDRMRVVRADGTMDESTYAAASSEMTVKFSEVPTLTIEQRIEQLHRMADEMAQQMSEHLFGTLNETLDRTGQTVDRKGKPFDSEAIFSALESIQIDFSDDGRHSPLTFVSHPDMQGKIKEAFEQIERESMLKARYEALIDKKKADWRDREAARKLVG